ncbi:four-helix bundle copper-binding protein [Fictibacillus sp. NPDC058756]
MGGEPPRLIKPAHYQECAKACFRSAEVCRKMVA